MIKISRRLYNNLVVWLDSQNLPGDVIIEITQINERLLVVKVDSHYWNYHTETEITE